MWGTRTRRRRSASNAGWAENPSVRDTLAAIEVARERLLDRSPSGIDVEAALLRARARLREDEAAAGEGSSPSSDEEPRGPRSRGR